MAHCGVRRAFFSRSPRSPWNVAFHYRPFSSSSKLLHEPVPIFTPTSSPELDALLERFRTDLFIPMSLTRPYRNMVFKPSKSEMLKKKQVTVTVNPGQTEEEYNLRPLRIEELPRRKDRLAVIQAMKASGDWRNLVPFLTGLVSSRRKVASRDFASSLRSASMSGNSQIALEAAKQSSRTGVSLGDIEVARAVFGGFSDKAYASEFKGDDLTSALRQAKDAALLLTDPRHIPTSKKAIDPKCCPYIASILLELSAAHALHTSEGKDATGDVQLYANAVVANWSLVSLQMPSECGPLHLELLSLLPLWHGMYLALQVTEVKRDNKLRNNLSSLMRETGEVIEKATARVEKLSPIPNRYGVIKSKSIYRKEAP